MQSHKSLHGNYDRELIAPKHGFQGGIGEVPKKIIWKHKTDEVAHC